jgi:tRNA threonylcarbamoyladenosine biosynthesis protein TsaE
MFETSGTEPQMTMTDGERRLNSAAETLAFGRSLATDLRGGDLLLLHGPLGAGKTVVAQGVAEGLGAATWRGSPTFALVNEYETAPRLVHLDLYRLTANEVEGLGLDDYMGYDTILVCEWPERADGYLRALAYRSVIDVRLAHTGGDERLCVVSVSRARDTG